MSLGCFFMLLGITLYAFICVSLGVLSMLLGIEVEAWFSVSLGFAFFVLLSFVDEARLFVSFVLFCSVLQCLCV